MLLPALHHSQKMTKLQLLALLPASQMTKLLISLILSTQLKIQLISQQQLMITYLPQLLAIMLMPSTNPLIKNQLSSQLKRSLMPFKTSKI
jgi:hypothetical protein